MSEAETNSPLLQVERLGKLYRAGGFFRPKWRRALEDVTFSLGRREVVALVGESGSGKSTVARLLARIEAPSKGRFLLDGRDVLAEEPRRASLAYRRRVQMIFQDPFASLNPAHTIGYQLERPLRLHGKVTSRSELESRVHALLDAVGLGPAAEIASRFPSELSGGQRQRIAIARALAVEPDLILADEPVSMLDVSIRAGIIDLMERLMDERGISFLYITHDLASARWVAQRTMVMYAGRIVESAPSEELLSRPLHPYTKLLLAAVPDRGGSFATALPARSGAPDLASTSVGCPFAPRCPVAIAACAKEMPGPTKIDSARIVRCHVVDPRGTSTPEESPPHEVTNTMEDRS